MLHRTISLYSLKRLETSLMFTRLYAGICLLLVAASASPIPGLYSTGGSPAGTTDPNWTVWYSSTFVPPPSAPYNPAYTTAQGSPSFSGLGYPFYAWMPNTAQASWISPQPQYGWGSTVYGDPVGYHYFALQFYLGPGYYPSTGTFSFLIAADNEVHSVWMNNTQLLTGIPGLSYNAPSGPITIGPGPGNGLQSGLNTLVVVVYNQPIPEYPGGPDPNFPGSWNPAGLWLAFTHSRIEEIPEPATLLTCGLGLIAIGCWRFRKG